MTRFATIEDINGLALLFDLYRVFYEQPSDITLAKKFLSDRITLNESVIIVKEVGENIIGFTQLFPIFSSVSAKRTWVLNDLFVEEQYRSKGYGKLLLDHAKRFVKDQGHKGLALETGKNNPARKLYEREGWVNDTDYLHYFWKNDA